MWPGPLITVTLLIAVLLAEAAHRYAWVPIPDPSRRIGCIDGLRGYLATFVFMHHGFLWMRVMRGHDWSLPKGNFYTNMGQASVALFFMITAVLFYSKTQRRLSDKEWLAYFISRIFRLTPLLWTAVAAIVLIVLAQNEWKFFGSPATTLLNLAQWLCFYGTPELFGHVHTDRVIASVTWTLAYEWGFYACLPAASFFLTSVKGRIRPIYVVLALFLFCERQIFRHYIGERYYILFVAGMLVAELIRIPKLAAWLRTRLAACIGLAALLSEVFFCPTAYEALPPILFLIFLAPVAAGNSYFKLFSLPGSIVLGEISYGIYLLHGILLYVAANTLVYRPGIYLLPMMAPVVIAVAVLAHRFVEMPAIDFGRRLSRSIPEIQLRIPGFRSQGALTSEQATGAENVP